MGVSSFTGVGKNNHTLHTTRLRNGVRPLSPSVDSVSLLSSLFLSCLSSSLPLFLSSSLLLFLFPHLAFDQSHDVARVAGMSDGAEQGGDVQERIQVVPLPMQCTSEGIHRHRRVPPGDPHVAEIGPSGGHGVG